MITDFPPTEPCGRLLLSFKPYPFSEKGLKVSSPFSKAALSYQDEGDMAASLIFFPVLLGKFPSTRTRNQLCLATSNEIWGAEPVESFAAVRMCGVNRPQPAC